MQQLEYDSVSANTIEDFHRQLKAYGENGWDLVTVLFQDSSYTGFFKRPLAQ